MSLQLLHQQDAPEHDQRRDRTVVNEGDEHGDDARQHGADHRDEGAEEHGDRDGNDQGKTQEESEQANADGIHGGHEYLHLDEGGQRHPSGDSRPVDREARLLGEEANHPEPDAAAIDEHEQRGEKHEKDAGEHVARG